MKLFFVLIFCSACFGCASKRPVDVLPPSNAVVEIGAHALSHGGRYPWHAGMTALEGIRATGGRIEFADAARVVVRHSNGTYDKYLYDKLRKGETKDPVLRSGDSVYVTTPLF